MSSSNVSSPSTGNRSQFCTGRLDISVLRAENLYNPSWGKEGSQDPWCKVTIGSHHVSTSVINNTPSPQWNYNDSFDLKGNEKEQCVCIEVFHKGFIGSSLIGSTTVGLTELLSKQGPTWFRLSKKHKKKDEGAQNMAEELYAGDVLIQAQFMGQGGPMQQLQPQSLGMSQAIAPSAVVCGPASPAAHYQGVDHSQSMKSFDTSIQQQQLPQQQPMQSDLQRLPTVSAYPVTAVNFNATSLGEPKIYYGDTSMFKGSDLGQQDMTLSKEARVAYISDSSALKQPTGFQSGFEGQQRMATTHDCTGCEKNL